MSKVRKERKVIIPNQLRSRTLLPCFEPRLYWKSPYATLDCLILRTFLASCRATTLMSFALAHAVRGQVQSLAWPSDHFILFHARFAVADFSLARFSRAGIALPSGIASAVPKRQAEYFYGRLCSHAALAAAGMPDVQVGTGRLREPLWPPGYTGSITHDGALAVAVVIPETLCAGVGVDVETVGHGSLTDALRDTIVSARELDYLATCTASMDMDMDCLLTLVFSAKESFYKGVVGLVGKVLEFDVVEVVALDARAGTLTFEVQQALGGAFEPGYRFQVQFTADATRVLTFFHRSPKSSC